MFSLSVLVLMTSFVLGITKPIDELRIPNEDKAEIKEDVKTGLESVKAVEGPEKDNLKAAVPENGNDEVFNKSRNLGLEQILGSDGEEIVKNSLETKVKEDTKTKRELEHTKSSNKPITANEKAKNVGTEKSEISNDISKKQVRSVTNESVTLDVEDNFGSEKSSKENSELKPRSGSTSDITKIGAVDVSGKVKNKDAVIKRQVRSGLKNKHEKTVGKTNAASSEETVENDGSTINLKQSEIFTIKNSEIPNEDKVFQNTGDTLDMKKHNVSVTKQNDNASSRSELEESLKNKEGVNQSPEKISPTSSDIASAKVAIDGKDKIASLESHVNDNASIKLIDKLTSQKALQKRSKNSSEKTGEDILKADKEGSLQETDETINDLKQGLSDNEDSSEERSKSTPAISAVAPTRRNNSDQRQILKTTQDKSARPLLEFSKEDEFSDIQQLEIPRRIEQQKIQPEYYRHITNEPIAAKNLLPFNNYVGGAGTPQLQNVLLQSYHPLALRPLPQNFFVSPSLRVFRSPTQDIKKFGFDETMLSNTPGFSPAFNLPNRPSFPHSGYNPQVIPPFEALRHNILAQNIHSPVTSQTRTMQNLKTPTLQQNQYSPLKSGNFDNFKDYLNEDDDNPQIEDYISLDQNAYIYQSKKLNAKPRVGKFPTNLKNKLTRASTNPEISQRQRSQPTVSNLYEF